MLLIEVTQPYSKIHCTGDKFILPVTIWYGTANVPSQINILDLQRN